MHICIARHCCGSCRASQRCFRFILLLQAVCISVGLNPATLRTIIMLSSRFIAKGVTANCPCNQYGTVAMLASRCNHRNLPGSYSTSLGGCTAHFSEVPARQDVCRRQSLHVLAPACPKHHQSARHRSALALLLTQWLGCWVQLLDCLITHTINTIEAFIVRRVATQPCNSAPGTNNLRATPQQLSASPTRPGGTGSSRH